MKKTAQKLLLGGASRLNFASDSRIVGWYSAKVSSTLTATGTAATGFADMSGAAVNLAQANTALSPIVVSDGINGHQALDFGNSVPGEYRAMFNSVAGHLKDKTRIKLYAAFRPTNDHRALNGFSPNPFNALFGIGNTDTNGLALGAAPNVGSNQTTFGVRHWASDVEAAGAGFTNARGSFFNDRPIILEIELKSSGPLFWMNGLDIIPDGLVNATLATDLSPDALNITQNNFALGGQPNGSGYVDWFEGVFGEAIFADAEMTENEINQIRRHLSSEWDIPLIEAGVHIIQASQSNGVADQGITADVTISTDDIDVTAPAKNVFTDANGASVLRLTDQTSAASGGKWGPEQAAARHIARKLQRPVLLNKEAVGGTNIDYWHPATGTGGIQLLSELQGARTRARGAGIELQTPVFVFYQGEWEAASTQENAEGRQAKLVALKAAWRAALGEPNMRWIDIKIHPDGNGARTATVNDGIDAAALLDNGLTVTVDVGATTLVDESGTFIHVDADGTLYTGYGYGDAYLNNANTTVALEVPSYA